MSEVINSAIDLVIDNGVLIKTYTLRFQTPNNL